jgi:uncharacterized SAM-binding protein YcdF (DUF218 family)
MGIIYIISKFFTFLLLPPGIFIILFFVAAFYAKKYKAVFVFFALCFYLLSNTLVSNFLLEPLEKPYNKIFTKNTQADAVIILGGGNVQGSANLPLTSSAYKRAIYGLFVAKTQSLPLLFSGGGFVGQESEASSFLKSMYEIDNYLAIKLPFSKKLEIGKFSILTEDKSLNTFQNAKFTKAKFDKIGIKKPMIYLVTSAFHMTRAKLLYEHFGFKVIPSATDFKVNHRNMVFWDLFPHMYAFEDSFLALHEYAGLFSLKLRGI